MWMVRITGKVATVGVNTTFACMKPSRWDPSKKSISVNLYSSGDFDERVVWGISRIDDSVDVVYGKGGFEKFIWYHKEFKSVADAELYCTEKLQTKKNLGFEFERLETISPDMIAPSI
ncbi:hypothetical protein [Enterovibrio norvegicus]|uniref:hypothetical protein n=1 Tax=Enterovibrio norvegicus TaxID=188144 RepID=UPI00352C739D